MTDKTQLLPVTQADRAAYCDYEDLEGKYRERVMSGAWDNVVGVQAFARHRDAEARRCTAIMQRITQSYSLPGDVLREAWISDAVDTACDGENGKTNGGDWEARWQRSKVRAALPPTTGQSPTPISEEEV